MLLALLELSDFVDKQSFQPKLRQCSNQIHFRKSLLLNTLFMNVIKHVHSLSRFILPMLTLFF